MKFTPHMGIAAAMVVLTSILTMGTFIGGIPSYDLEKHDLKLQLDEETLQIGTAAGLSTQFVGYVPDAREQRRINPFTLRPESHAQYQLKISMPPPPQLMLPDLPALPVASGDF